ncbi:MAG: hypothetical protein IT292_11925 [Deltaproteobacteria bacterium]|nr:hypothetical protein [Deltaproteobacteria bacterium]
MSFIENKSIDFLATTLGVDISDFRTAGLINKINKENKFSNSLAAYYTGGKDTSSSAVNEHFYELLSLQLDHKKDELNAIENKIIEARKEINGSGKSDNMQPGIESYDDYAEAMKLVLAPDAQGKINEEQLQHGIVYYMLNKQDEKLGKEYLDTFENIVSSMSGEASPEDIVKASLKILVSNGKVSAEDAEKINGISFRAAQIDDNLTALYDSKGSESDNTIAALPMEEALEKTLANLEGLETGEITADARSLNAPSNVAPQAMAGAAEGGFPNGSGGSGHGGGKGGFLWKPISESDGKLAVLLPSSLTGSVAGLEIYSGDPENGGQLLDRGRFTGATNGNRATFRFGKPGSGYPDNCYVVARLDNGQTQKFQIPDSSQRVE